MLTIAYHAVALRGALPASTTAIPFIITGGPRSGSTMLQTLLDSHPNAICMHELLRDSTGTAAFRRHCLGRRKQLMELREQDMPAFVHEVLTLPHPPWIRALGFKALYTQPRKSGAVRQQTWEGLRQIPGLRVIWIQRNLIRCVVSFAIAKQTQGWIGKKTREPVAVDVDYVLRRLAVEEKRAEEVKSYLQGIDIISVSYERVRAHPVAEMSIIQKALSLPVRSVQTSLQRQNPQPLAQLVSNYADLQQALLDTRWGGLLDEALQPGS